MRPWPFWRSAAPAHTGARRPGGRLRRHRDEPSLRAPRVLQRPSRGRAHRGKRARRPLPHHLVAHSRRLGQVSRPHPSRRQPRGGRHPRAHGPGHPPGDGAPGLLHPLAPRALRRCAPLRRRDDHPRHLRAQRHRGPHRRYAVLRAVRDPSDRGCSRRSLRTAAPGYECPRGAVRAHHRRVVLLSRRPGRGGNHPISGRAGRGEPDACGALFLREWCPGLSRAGIGVPGGHRLRGAVCRYGPLRPPAHPARLVRGGPACAAPQLPRPGRPAAPRPRPGGEPLLSPGAVLGPVSAGRAGDGGDRHRVTGRDQRRVLADVAGGPARAPAARARGPHLGG